MSELAQWVSAIVFSIFIIGYALFYLNSTSRKHSGEVASLTVKVGLVALSVGAALTSFVAAAVID
ncbi:hypothetical protein ACI0FM_12810 [Paenochrobactrum sp. BZR 588]|uniref:hypothetical protein n=1 Tax=Paenochrobactrum TaxID=999488 RepID=UPI0035BC0B64